MLKVRFYVTVITLVVSLIGCTKDIVQDPISQPSDYHKLFDPPIQCGWVGQTSFEKDSTFYLSLDLNGDSITDCSFRLREGEEPYDGGASTIILPYQELTFGISNGFMVHKPINVPAELDSGEFIGTTNFIESDYLRLAWIYPLHYHFFTAGERFLAIRHQNTEGKFFYGWIKLRITGVNDFPIWEERAVIYIHEVFLSSLENQPIIVGNID